MITIERLTKKYGATLAVDDVSFTAEAGRVTGFMLGVLIRASTGALVAYFILTFLVPTVFGLLADSQHWFHQLQPWVDIQFAQAGLFVFAQPLTGLEWAHIAVTGVTWLLLPLLVGLGLVMRAEVK